MQMSLKILGLIALGLTVVPPILFLMGAIALPLMKGVMLGGCVLWFATAPFFMKGGS
jgi:hypothetical protein